MLLNLYLVLQRLKFLPTKLILKCVIWILNTVWVKMCGKDHSNEWYFFKNVWQICKMCENEWMSCSGQKMSKNAPNVWQLAGMQHYYSELRPQTVACHNITWSPPRVGRVTVPRFIIVQPTNSSTKKQWVEISSNSNFWNRAVELWLGSWTLPNFISIKQANKLKQNGEIGSRLSTTVRKTWAWCMFLRADPRWE